MGIIGNIFGAVVVIFVIAALITPIANNTTGVTIQHAGGPAVNPNLTNSPATIPLLQLYPLIFAAIGLLFGFKVVEHESSGGFLFVKLTTRAMSAIERSIAFLAALPHLALRVQTLARSAPLRRLSYFRVV